MLIAREEDIRRLRDKMDAQLRLKDRDIKNTTEKIV
jgi:hypothetical protein